MPTAPVSATRPVSRPVEVRRRVVLDVGRAPDVLVRVLTVLRRRQCRIVAVEFRESDHHGPGRFDVTIVAPARTADRVAEWLLGLVDVYEVSDAGTPPTRLIARARRAGDPRVAL
jgi:acetolactate synthase regulatory subunit